MMSNHTWSTKVAAVLGMVLLCAVPAAAQGVAVNDDGSAADGSAMLDVSAPDKGVLVPRLSEAERDAIASPATGLLIYQTDVAPGFYFYDGGAWRPVTVSDHVVLTNVQTDQHHTRYTDADARRAVGNPDPPCFSNDDRYADCGNGTVTDGVSGLVWMQNAQCNGLMNWKQANDWAVQLADPACGLTDGSQPGDWRLPTKAEWQAVMDRATTNGCVVPGPFVPDDNGLGCWTSGVDAFSGVQANNYWSSATNAGDPTIAWNAYLNVGIVSADGKALSLYAWPVRVTP